MPRCSLCGNRRLFGSSQVPPTSQYSNGPLSGMIADFDSHDNIASISSLGANKATVKEAIKHPTEFFDICIQCGKQSVEWKA